MIGVDTLAWQKIILLRQKKEWNSLIDEILEKMNFFITTEGKNEFEYRFPNDLDIVNQINVLPVLNDRYSNYMKLGFDPADASLLEYTDIRKYRIITEDRPMIAEGSTSRKNIIFLIDFFRELAEGYRFITSKELYKLVKLFRKWKNITKKKAKEILK